MADTPKAWVWSQYRAVVSQGAAAPLPLFGNASASGTQSTASAKRTRWGIFLAIATIVGLLFPKIAVLLLILSGLMVLSGLEPKRFEDFFSAIPGGAIIARTLTMLDALLP